MSFFCDRWSGDLGVSVSFKIIIFKLTWGTFSHDSEKQPWAKFIGVIRTGDEVEELREGISIRYRHFPYFSAGRAEVLQQQVDTQVPQLTELEN